MTCYGFVSCECIDQVFCELFRLNFCGDLKKGFVGYLMDIVKFRMVEILGVFCVEKGGFRVYIMLDT